MLKNIIKVDTDLFSYDGDTQERCCGKSECREAYQAKQKEQKEKLNEYNLNQQKKEETCRQYNKKCQNIEDLENQKKNLLRCQKCQQIPDNGKYYEVGGEGQYCKSCAKKVATDNNENEKPTNKTPRTSTSNQSPCEKCNLTFSIYYNVGGKGHYCNSCADEIIKNPNNKKYDAKCQDCGIEIGLGTHCASCFNNKRSPSSNNDNSEKKKNIPPLRQAVYGQIKEERMKNAKEMIKAGSSCKNLILDDFSEKEKKELESYEKNRVDYHHIKSNNELSGMQIVGITFV
ncbi:10702_t:CDS:2 [Entrophospora sp. SA101]|nr:10702_t:CDS:2 [Entrophospora sp. SA101]